MSKNSILESIQKSKGYDIALFTTFNFEISFFERFIKNALFSNKTKKISVFVDSQELNKSISKEGDVHNIGHHYVVNPIEMNGSFHPKLVLLLGKKKAKLYVSSCNLTTSGYTINNEAFYSYECLEGTGDNKKLIVDAIDFFCKLNDLSFHADDYLFREVVGYRHIYNSFPDGNNDSLFVHNLDEPILNQIKTLTTEAELINVAVPYFDNECYAIKELSNHYDQTRIKLFLQNNKARIDVKKINSLTNVETYPFSGFKDRKNNNFYHGKVFSFLNGSDSYIAFGSANCTSSALVKSFKNGGNIEAVIIQKTTTDESNEFFENFKICSSETIKYDLLKYDSEDTGVFYFRNGLLSDTLHLYIGAIQIPEIITVLVDKEECDYTITGNTIDVSIGLESIPHRNTIYLDICYDDKTERVICWYTNPSEIQFTRTPSTPRRDLDDVDPDPNSSKYITDQIRISEALALNVDEYMSDIHTQRMLQRDSDSLIDDEEEFEDGVIDYIIPEDIDYIYHSKILKKLNGIKQFYYDRFFLLFASHNNKDDSETSNKHKIINSNPRKPTSDEKRFKRFINKRIRGFIDQELVDVVSFEHYIACATIFLSIFEKYSVDDPVKGLFDDEQTAEYRLAIAENLVKLANKEQNHQKHVLFLIIKVLLTNRFFVNIDWDRSYSLSNRTRTLLLSINSGQSSKARSFIEKKASLISSKELFCNEDTAITYINDLYGFLPLEKINSIMKHEFANLECGVDNTDPLIARVIVVTSNVNKRVNYENSKTINELKNYNRFNKKWNKIVLEFRLNKKTSSSSVNNMLVKVEHEYDFIRRTYKIISTYRNGSKTTKTPNQLW